MSYEEYDDLFEKAQKNGKHHIFVFDVIGSRHITANKNEPYYFFQINMEMLLYSVYKRLEKLEEKMNKIILHKSDKLIPFFEKREKANCADILEPFFGLSDIIWFTIIKDSIDSSLVYQIFEEEKERLNINYQFRYADGYYETDDYSEGNNLYYRGWCIRKLEKIARDKEKNKGKGYTL
jgi:hypothetical protein